MEQHEQAPAVEVPVLKKTSKTLCKALIFYNLICIGAVSLLTLFLIKKSGLVTLEITAEFYLMNIVVVTFATTFIVRHYQKSESLHIPFQTLKTSQVSTVIKYGMIGIGLSTVAGIFMNILVFIFQNFSFDLTTPDFSLQTDLPFNITLLVNVLIIAPFFEEWLYRGFLFHALRKHGDGFAMIITSLLFGFAHGNFIQAIPVFFLSLALCHVVMKTNSLYAAIVIHFFNNALSMVMMYFMNNDVLSAGFLVIEIAFIVYAVSFLIKKKARITSFFQHVTFNDVRCFFFGNWIAIIFSIYIIISMLSSITTL